MTTYTVERIIGGTYTGSGAAPGGTLTSVTTDGTNRYSVIICWTHRQVNAVAAPTNYHHVASVTLSGTTYTRVVSEEFYYQDSGASGSFPDNYWCLDVFIGAIPLQKTGAAVSFTMASAADNFVNNGWAVNMIINGATGADADSSNYDVTSDLTIAGTSTPTSAPLTSAANPLVILTAMQHSGGGNFTAITKPTGYASAGSVSGNAAFAFPGGGSGGDGYAIACFKEEASALAAASIAAGSAHNIWFEVPIILNGALSVPPPAVEPVIIITQ